MLLPVINLLATLALTLAPQAPCAQPPIFQPPVLPECDGTWNNGCLAECSAAYNSAMQRAFTIYCQAAHMAWDNYDQSVQNCEKSHTMCINHPNIPEKVCDEILQECQENALKNLSETLTRFAKNRVERENAARAAWDACIRNCCQ